MSDTPFIWFGNNTLLSLPTVHKGDFIVCPTCQQKHELYCGKDADTNEESDLLMFYKCGSQSYLGALAGKLITGVEADVSGRLDDMP